jgi:hypothetical protein
MHTIRSPGKGCGRVRGGNLAKGAGFFIHRRNRGWTQHTGEVGNLKIGWIEGETRPLTEVRGCAEV